MEFSHKFNLAIDNFDLQRFLKAICNDIMKIPLDNQHTLGIYLYECKRSNDSLSPTQTSLLLNFHLFATKQTPATTTILTILIQIIMSLRPLFISGLLATASAFAPTTTNHVVSRSTTSLNVAVDTSDIKNGLTIELDGEPYKVLNFSIMKQARGAAKTTIKFKNLKRGNTIENTYRSGEKFETAQIDKKPSQYTYEDEVRYVI